MYFWWLSALGPFFAIVILGIYIGLRTGIFECSLPFAAFRWTKLKIMEINDATAVGIGFGSTEAIVIAVPALMQLALAIIDPSAFNSLPPDQLQAIETQLSQPVWIAAFAISDRVFTILAHIFATLLVFIAAVSKRLAPLFGAVLYKAKLDGQLPIL